MILEFLSFNSLTTAMLLLTGVMLIFSMFGFIGNININSGGGNINISGSGADNELVEEDDETIDVGDINKIVIENPLGDIRIHIIDEPKIKLHKSLYLPKSVQDNEEKRVKDTFKQLFLKKNNDTVELNVPKMAVMSIMTVKVDLDLSLPKNMSLKHLAGVNDIEVDGLVNDVDLTNNVGNMNLKNLSGKLFVHTNSGNITGENIKNPVSVTANVGDISFKSVNISNLTEKLHSNVGKVDVDIDNVETGANCKIESNTGDVQVAINSNANVSLEASTNMGQLEVDPKIHIISKGGSFMGGSIVGVVNQVGGKLSISSSTGKVQVKLR